MISLLSKLFCNHKWKIFNSTAVRVRGDFGNYHAVDYHMQCTKCSALRRKRLIGGL